MPEELDSSEVRRRLDHIHVEAEGWWGTAVTMVAQAAETPDPIDRAQAAHDAAVLLVEYLDAAKPDTKAIPEGAAEELAMAIVRIIAETERAAD